MGHYTNKPQQHLQELSDYVAYLKGKQIKSYLEIGSKYGGCLWAVVQGAMPPKSKVVAVDLPNNKWGRSDSEPVLKECFAHLKRQGHDAHLFFGDSTHANIVSAVKGHSPFDAVFIDANHTEHFVRTDFANYGRLAPICCFHDIGWNNPTLPGRKQIEVPKVWAELKQTYKDVASFREIKHDVNHNGIGIIEWHN